jgi:hypothetical protein
MHFAVDCRAQVVVRLGVKCEKLSPENLPSRLRLGFADVRSSTTIRMRLFGALRDRGETPAFVQALRVPRSAAAVAVASRWLLQGDDVYSRVTSHDFPGRMVHHDIATPASQSVAA